MVAKGDEAGDRCREGDEGHVDSDGRQVVEHAFVGCRERGGVEEGGYGAEGDGGGGGVGAGVILDTAAEGDVL